jgi:hypothetical protein
LNCLQSKNFAVRGVEHFAFGTAMNSVDQVGAGVDQFAFEIARDEAVDFVFRVTFCPLGMGSPSGKGLIMLVYI